MLSNVLRVCVCRRMSWPLSKTMPSLRAGQLRQGRLLRQTPPTPQILRTAASRGRLTQGMCSPSWVPFNLQHWVAWPWPQRLTLCRHSQHLTGPFALGLTASLTSSARRLIQPGPMACHTPECIRREARLADWELAVAATQEELAATATQEEPAVLNEHASEPWEATPAATDQLEDEDMLDAGSE